MVDMFGMFERCNEGGRLRKLAFSGLLAAIAVLLSGFSFPVGPSRCFPIQHAVNAVAGVLLGPWWALGSAVVAASIRNLMGTGTILAFPGSIFGALAVGFAARLLPREHRLYAAFAEPFATSAIGAYVSTLIMAQAGKTALFSMLSAAFFASSAPGAAIGFLMLCSLRAAARKSRTQKTGG